MTNARIADELCELIANTEIAPDELAMVISNSFSRGWMPGTGRDVFHGSEDEEVALHLTYSKSGRIATAQAGPALTDEVVLELIDRIRALTTGGEATLWRSTLFSAVPLEGYWRYQHSWQIRPIPPDAPQPPQLYAPHPFILEARGLMVSQPFVGAMQSAKKLTEIRLVLSLVLQGGLQPAGLGHHAWFIETEPEFRAKFGHIGYHFSPPDWPSDDFSPVDDLDLASEVPAVEYYQRRGVSYERPLDVPDILAPLADALGVVTEPDRERFFRAAYWFDRAQTAWHVSTSLSYISYVNAIEVLAGAGTQDLCPTCGLNRAPGPTARFRQTVERYAGDVPGREELYRLRSSLVHGDKVLLADGPQGIGFTPDTAQERSRHDLALRVSRAVIVGWMLDAENMRDHDRSE